MFRDRDEELKRLQEQLLDEEAAEEIFLDEDMLDALLEEDRQGQKPGVYQNFSNRYGRELRNFASGYKAYNSDTTDTDLESFSEMVREPKKTIGLAWIPVLLILLLAAVVVAVVWRYVRQGGIW